MASVTDRAYALWEARGRPIGDDLHDWFAAERELRRGGQRMQLVTLPPIAFSVTLENPIAGICLASVQGNAEGTSRVPILPGGFFTSDDGPELYVYLDSLFNYFLAKTLARAGFRIEDIDNCLVNIVDGTNAKIWVNFPTVMQSIAKGAVTAGQPVTLDALADIRSVSFRTIPMPSHGAIAYTFQHGWRRALYFDFSMVVEEPNRPLTDLSALLGSLHAALIFRERIQMKPDILGKMFRTGWFPFIRLPNDLSTGLYRHFQENWDHAPIEEEIVRVLSPAVPTLLEGWSKKATFAPHLDVLRDGLRLFGKGEYTATTALLLPKVEGILRTLNMGRGPAGARNLRANLLARVRAQVAGATAFLPEAFVQYLEDFYYAGFDLDANNVPPSRHSFMHGIGPDAEAAKPAFCMKLLLTLDQLFFYA
jgi:hypothetical protein